MHPFVAGDVENEAGIGAVAARPGASDACGGGAAAKAEHETADAINDGVDAVGAGATAGARPGVAVDGAKRPKRRLMASWRLACPIRKRRCLFDGGQHDLQLA
jgi:hypothetical protein